MPIGQVVHILADEFDGVTVSKIRFLETQGLVNPERSDSGIRIFADDDLERLRYILRAQRDRFWPLRVIKEHLEQVERAAIYPGSSLWPSQPAAPDAEPATHTNAESAAAPATPAAGLPPRRRAVRVTPAVLRERTGLDTATYAALKSFGLLRVDTTGRHGVEDIEIAEQAAALARYGIEARHLRLFRVAADREVGLAEQVLEPLRRRRTRGAPGPDPEHVQADIVTRSLALHTALVQAGLRTYR